MHGLLGNALTLYFEIRKQGRLLARYADQIHQRIDVLNENRTKITYQRVLQIIVGGMTATQDQTLAIEHPRLGIVPKIDSYRVATSRIVDLMKTLLTDRDELRLIVCRTRRLGIPFHTSRPEDIRLSLSHPVDVAFQLLIGIDRYMCDKVIITFHS